MSNDRAIPQGYMTVGEIAKKMGVSVRTLQYYHREGLLSPSAQSGGGRRLYTDRDVILLHQILSMKHLGFSLDDIKNRLIGLDTPEEVAAALSEQAAAIRQKLASLSESLVQLEALRAEVLQMQAVDFKKYADIIANLEMKNELYWLVKHLDDRTLNQFRRRFDHASAPIMMERVSQLMGEALRLQAEGVPPAGERGMAFAEKYWAMVLDFTGGDTAMLADLMKLSDKAGAPARRRNGSKSWRMPTLLSAPRWKPGSPRGIMIRWGREQNELCHPGGGPAQELRRPRRAEGP